MPTICAGYLWSARLWSIGKYYLFVLQILYEDRSSGRWQNSWFLKPEPFRIFVHIQIALMCLLRYQKDEKWVEMHAGKCIISASTISIHKNMGQKSSDREKIVTRRRYEIEFEKKNDSTTSSTTTTIE